jgi:hypothetical protein
MKQKRDQIFVWPTWISKLVAGEENCFWKYWFKAHYKCDKKSGDFNLTKWTIEHTKLLRKRVKELERLGYTVTIEDQNSFRFDLIVKPQEGDHRKIYKDGGDIVISGKADIVAIKGDENIVEDCKTGNPKVSDHIQVLIYMLLLPLSIEKFKNQKFLGRIVYKDNMPNVDIPIKTYEDEDLKREIWDTIKLIAGDEENCRKVPSMNECKRCDITCENCKERVE